jgi:indoleamine 2,3-dioxygenase
LCTEKALEKNHTVFLVLVIAMPALIQPSPRQSPAPEDALLRKFDVSHNGFLPDSAPLKVLADPYYGSWELLIQQLSSSLAAQTFRGAVDRLEVLSTEKLHTEDEWRRAYVILAFLAHGYIWGGDRPAEVCNCTGAFSYFRI